MTIERKINGLDLFTGIGGLSVALQEWVRPIAYCDNDPYCQALLLSLMDRKQIPRAPIWDNVETLGKNEIGKEEEIEIIYGGFPCQDISIAGTGAGLGGKRSSLFKHITRLTNEIRPSFVFIENVPAVRTRGLFHIVASFTSLGYDCRWTVVSAAELGAPHIRERWFLLAHSKRDQIRLQPRWRSGESRKNSTDMVDKFWENTEPTDNRVCDGLPEELDRVKAMGNAVIPIQAKVAFQRLMGLETN